MMALSTRFSSRQIGSFASIVLFAAAGGTACGSQNSSVTEAPSSFADVLAPTLLQGGSIVDNVLNVSVSRCMVDQGFEIDVVDPMIDEADISDEMTEIEVDTYGYGISTDPPQTDAPAVDPIEQAVAALKPGEVDAFNQALLGSPDPSELPSPESCLGRAFDDIEKIQRFVTDEVAVLTADYTARVDADPRIVEARAGWRVCIADHGSGVYSDRLEIIEDISDRMALAGAAIGDVQAFERQIARIDYDCSQAEMETRSHVESELSADFAEDMAALTTGRSGD